MLFVFNLFFFLHSYYSSKSKRLSARRLKYPILIVCFVFLYISERIYLKFFKFIKNNIYKRKKKKIDALLIEIGAVKKRCTSNAISRGLGWLSQMIL